MTVFERIEQQQQGKEDTAVWMVGEQLKDICRREPACGELLEEDLQNPDMSLEKAEKKIAEYARAHKKGDCGVCPPNVAERILREFYGLPGAGETEAKAATLTGGNIISLADLFG